MYCRSPGQRGAANAPIRAEREILMNREKEWESPSACIVSRNLGLAKVFPVMFQSTGHERLFTVSFQKADPQPQSQSMVPAPNEKISSTGEVALVL